MLGIYRLFPGCPGKWCWLLDNDHIIPIYSLHQECPETGSLVPVHFGKVDWNFYWNVKHTESELKVTGSIIVHCKKNAKRTEIFISLGILFITVQSELKVNWNSKVNYKVNWKWTENYRFISCEFSSLYRTSSPGTNEPVSGNWSWFWRNYHIIVGHYYTSNFWCTDSGVITTMFYNI